ncbi:hypothetical protein A2757_02720 [Candidatus Giovannonibacteria bacterium RIFCSPHIGHO2_01_FULL_48_47]|nr:MAG: hypothetical protein A2757_02720 [Candidatus Giovannonibacteria bacterium RIFCSPHIGHO2_01_FULL_48_47]OGF88176.1 MAG: hypothetical protein A3B26_00510 [Candidatus Giovannonibacteria bacterium RIFCSPLOWO2_01_FULL_48_47]OGF95435.1 MAG: hypothetical protein A2433_00770 [Candidatus Giovannonibacteria bacterium RIFOXYC1_FULL_48_8]OGF95984.1 MAG: hypothetical protein A2613_00205 [Candidatus Giovannonibacteria bacterium RIFOXYD1_FULL_48_21]
MMKKVGMLGWIFASLMYLGGLVSMALGSEFLNVNYMTWYWNALVLGVLVLGSKLGVLIMLKEEKRM